MSGSIEMKMRILVAIKILRNRYDAVTNSLLHRKLHVTSSWIRKPINDLLNDGFIEIVPHENKTVKNLALTPQGEVLASCSDTLLRSFKVPILLSNMDIGQ